MSNAMLRPLQRKQVFSPYGPKFGMFRSTNKLRLAFLCDKMHIRKGKQANADIEYLCSDSRSVCLNFR